MIATLPAGTLRANKGAVNAAGSARVGPPSHNTDRISRDVLCKVRVTPLQLDPETHKLLCTRLDSFEKLEIVRLLRASGRPMSRAELETAGRFSTDTVFEVLGSLAQGRLIEIDEATSLVRLGTPEHERAFHALMSVYEGDRAAVLSLLSTIAMERIRSMAARAFADAFVLRRKRDRDDG